MMSVSKNPQAAAVESQRRLRVVVRGAVQGVGFRPFIFRLAQELGLHGWVSNSAQGVFIEVEGTESVLKDFQFRIERDKPPRSFIQSLEASFLDPVGCGDFKIRPSTLGAKTAIVLPDIATCPDCRREIFDPKNRRHRYPFTNCTYCGPRYSIIEALPYDRANTTMKGFAMCPACRAEYEDPLDRRFHAQPNACPDCGPHLELWDGDGRVLAGGQADGSMAGVVPAGDRRRSQKHSHEGLLAAAEAVRQGRIVALKGMGGFQLLVDARNEEAVRRLRQRKQRDEKPLALMFPDLASIRECCVVTDLEERLLVSPEAPIVLLRKSQISNLKSQISPAVAPGNPYLGVMLPYTPLHHLLMAELGFPVVATSGNLSDEPICLDEKEALERLPGIADVFLVHNRPIVRQVDDSVARVMLGRELVIRRARGYAPLPIHLKQTMPSVLAVGAHLKNAVAISVGGDVFVSQHIGDLETTQAYEAFQATIQSLTQLYDLQPEVFACDAHPDYRSTQFARRAGAQGPKDGSGPPRAVVAVQHHYAHVLSCMAENELEPPVLGVAWDGTGFGLDGTVWGGEFLHVDEETFSRVAHLRRFRLPGGDRAVKEPRRSALGLLHEVLGDELFSMTHLAPVKAFTAAERDIVKTMLQKGLQSPLTSSAGRLFDAVASLVGLRQVSRFEGQSAMELEFALDEIQTEALYPLRLSASGKLPENRPDTELSLAVHVPKAGMQIDWEPMVWGILEDLRYGTSVGLISAKFHNTLAESMVAVAKQIGETRVALSGGCFQNRYLTEQTVKRLTRAGFRPYWHQRIPPNDGGIALGQVWAAARSRKKE
jgi:hydrogenase maturation protein HypF